MEQSPSDYGSYMYFNFFVRVIFSAALNAYYAQMQMDSVGISCSSPARSSTSSALTTTTPALSGQGQPHILRKATRKRNKGDITSSISSIQQQNDATVIYFICL